MSADLLAEFGQPQSFSKENDKKVSQPNGQSRHNNQDLIPDVLDVVHDARHAKSADRREQSASQNLWHRDDHGAEVLFDASIDQLDPEDDFGDFEDGRQDAAQNQPADLLHIAVSRETSPNCPVQLPYLLDLEGSMNRKESQHHEDEWGDFTGVPDDRTEHEGLCPQVLDYNLHKACASETREEWKPFEDCGAANSFQLTKKSPPGETSIDRQETFQSSKEQQNLASADGETPRSRKEESRPTNIPPPAVLLQCLPQMFSIIANADHTQPPANACTAIVQAHTIASRLIAGRTLRWKRDAILSQSTKIGPAACGRKGGGMKLAAVDRSENLKEEREVAEVLQAWAKHARFFNSTVNKAGIRRPLMTLSEKPRPRPLKGAGVLTSKQACALCGLKRDERVPEADVNVDDSFGEYWSEHWGHVECKKFWYQNQALLPQR